MPLGTNDMTTTTGNVFRRDVWSKELIRATESNLVIGDKVWRFDSETTGAKIVQIPSISNFTAQDKVANTQVVLQSPTDTSITLTLDKHKHAAFLVEDILAVQANYNLMSEYAKKAAYAIKKAVDTDLANLATGLSTNKGTYNTTLTVAVMLSTVQALDDNDVPQEDRCWILKPKAVADLRTLSDYMRYDGTGYAGGHATGGVGNATMRPAGLVGQLYNSPVYQTTQIAQSGNNISNLYIHKQAFALGMQKSPRVQSEYKLEYLGDLTVADVMYGVIETRDSFGVELRA